MLEKMKEIIAEQLSVEEEIVTESSSFKEDLGADSLDLFELVMALEDEYSIEIPELPERQRCRGVMPCTFLLY